jgi:outer membrane protein assembly factor BamB
MTVRTVLLIVVCVAAVVSLAASLGSEELNPQERAASLVAGAGVKGGLIVHLGCGGGQLTAALYRGSTYRIHGLDADPECIQQARRFIRSTGLYGPVSVEQWGQSRLPYGDNLVNLLIVEELGPVPMREVMRVLVPGGVAYVKRGSAWRKEVKQRPQETDEWTHYLHDASGNAVAHDEVVGPPRHIQWVAEPRHTRSHEHTPSINALVSSAGRIFYIADEAPIVSVKEPPQWHLVARDAYNGILLWKRSFAAWFPHLINWGVTPPQLQRRLVAVGDRLYVTLGLHSPLSALDATTGETVRTYEETDGTEEIVCHKGVLLLAVRRVTDARAAKLAEWSQLSRQKGSPIHARESAQPLVDRFRAIEAKADKAVVAFDADTGRLLWRKAGAEAAGLRALSLCASGDRAFYQNGKHTVCLDLMTGRELWSSPATGLRLVYNDSVFCVAGRTAKALSAETGDVRWTQTALLSQIRDVFVADGALWLGGFKPCEGKRSPAWGPYFVTQRDPATGKVLKHIEPENPGHHHRCYQNKATDRYILAGRRGVEFFDLRSGDVREHSWVRGVCRYGVMPCNGLLYAPPHACACYVGTKMTGFCALASVQEPVRPEAAPAETKGFVSSECDPPGSSTLRIDSGLHADKGDSTSRNSWPTYRHDGQRSGSTRAFVGTTLRPKWQARIGGCPSSPTVDNGMVFVACTDRHEVLALESDSGMAAWTFTAGGAVDSPPTIHGDRVLFGCRDGNAYALRASDGALAWRFQGARTPRRIMACGQLESASPAHGSVLVQNDVVYCTMGRSSYLDGGIGLYRLDPETGRMLSRTQVYSPDPQTGKQPPQSAPYAMPGVRSDILTGDGEYIYLRDAVFDGRGAEQPQGRPHLFTLTDFLDDSWPHRSYWIFGTRCSISTGCSGQKKGLTYGRLLVFDDSTVYGYGRAKLHWSNQLQDGAYRLFAAGRDEGKTLWEKPVRLHVRAMLLADKTLFIAGCAIGNENGPAGPNETEGGLLLAVAASDGATIAQYRLKAPPVFDGMAAVANRLFLTLENGSLVCMEGNRP